MKKSLFFVAAASALMLTACSSENDVLQSATPSQPVVQQAVGFDVYTPAATNVTRAGLVGTMTTTRMQRPDADEGGFGVYAFLTEDTNDDGGTSESSAAATAYARGSKAPNFMYNEKVLWNSTNLGWYYNPLKYWPNETDNDSQSTPTYMQTSSANQHLDRLTFFAYAPYVSAGSGSTGITAISDNTGKLSSVAVTDPTVKWVATTSNSTFNPNEGVDLLWGVAPSGGLSYTAVNGWTVTRNEYTPLLNMIKPDVNTSMKFLFQHALARFGVNVVAAIDQVSPGGELDPNTKITINSFSISGPFGTQGELNLNNDGKPGVANWTEIQNTSITSDKKAISSTQTITVTANDETPANNAIAENLRWKGPHTAPVAQNVIGVTSAKQDLLVPSNKWFTKLASTPAYNPAKQYYDVLGNPVKAKYTTTTKGEVYELSGGKYVAVESGTPINAPVYPNYDKDGKSPYYTVTEDKEYLSKYPNGENSYTKKRYKFESYGDPACTEANKYGEGIVEVAAVGTSKTRVIVLKNDADTGYEGQEFWVEGKSFTPNAIYRLQQPSNNPLNIWVKVIQEVKYGYNDENLDPDKVLYKKNGTGTDEDPCWYEYAGKKNEIDWENNNTYVTLNEGLKVNVNDFDYAYDPTGTYYEAERNYLYVVPTNNVATNDGLTDDQKKALRTITVQIAYYITTKDDKLNGGFAQTENVITKEVVLPSLANGKTYMLNVVLGLTSVKIDAEVADWKVENIQTDLPQNTGN